MVLNNFHAHQRLDEWIEGPLTPDRVLEIQAVVTERTLEDEESQGRRKL